jgi:hypothetical protein
MSVTYPGTTFAPVEKRDLAARHPQLMPFLVAVGIFVVTGLVALAFTGLPT